MAAANKTARFAAIVVLALSGAVVGNLIYADTFYPPPYKCPDADKYCQLIYSPGHPSCNANFPDCVSFNTPIFQKCIPANGNGCSEFDQAGSTTCAGRCSKPNPFGGWQQAFPPIDCDFTLGHCN